MSITKEKQLGRLAEVEAQIKELQKERDELRQDCVEFGWATWKYKVRLSAPSLAWWKEHRPASWQKHANPVTVKTFKVLAD